MSLGLCSHAPSRSGTAAQAFASAHRSGATASAPLRALRNTILLTVGLALASACTQTRVNVDESQRQVTARTEAGQEVVYRFGAIPQSWRRIDMSEGADVAWDAQNGNVVHVDHACGRSMDSPLPALVQQMLIGFEAREFVEEETIAFDGREARHVLVRARLDGRPIVIELYVLKKDGCVFDLSATGEPSHFDSVRPEFQAFAQGFRSERTPLDQGPEQRR